MDRQEWLVRQFEEHRLHMRRVMRYQTMHYELQTAPAEA
jgi:hypothetical protein